MPEKMFNIGKIVNTQGIKGEVRVVPLTDFPERFFGMKEILVLQQGQLSAYHPEQVREHKNFILIKFAEVPDMNAAEQLKGALLQVPESELADLPEGYYYLHQLEGLEVRSVDGTSLGAIKEILAAGANDVWVVRDSGGKEIMIPAVKPFIKSVDVAAGYVLVELPEGL